MYENDPDYLGTLQQMDVQFGNLMAMLEKYGIANNTVILYTSDNGPHQGAERTDIHYSTNFMRQCKASNWEGGIRVPGMMYAPPLIQRNLNITTPVGTWDFLPTIMELLEVESDHPDWIMDGISLVPIVQGHEDAPREAPIGFSWGSQQALIDGTMKLIYKPSAGQCDFQEPYSSMKSLDDYYLYDLASDFHEMNDLKHTQPDEYQRMLRLLNNFRLSLNHSQYEETKCAGVAPGYTPPPMP
jgi:arylsulfatase A-like enzyme